MSLRIARVPFLAAALLSMAYGIWLGLLRLGWMLPLPWPDQLILHGPLMVSGFLGTLISVERAIGMAKRWAYIAPSCTVAGALVLVVGPPGPIGPLLWVMASALVVLLFLGVGRRQPSLSVATMLAGGVCWFIGNVAWFTGAAIYRVVFWWMTFLVLTIVGERLELARVLKPTRFMRGTFLLAMAVLIGGSVMIGFAPPHGSLLLGGGLTATALWLLRHDVAKRTIRQPGAPRYIASCLLAGYVWLSVGGVLLLVTNAISPGTQYDAILHAVFIGFAVSMIFGHALIVFPAVTGLPLAFDRFLYVPLAMLHGSVLLRIVGDLFDEMARLRSWGGLFTAIAILAFIGSVSVASMRGADFRPAGARRTHRLNT